MSTQFTPEFFKGNRERLRSLFTGKAPIVLTANGSLQRNSDNEYPFRQDSNFWYLTGIDLPNVILVMDKSREYAIIPDRDPVVEAFDGKLDFDLLEKISGIAEILEWKDGWRLLSSKLKRSQHIATLAPPPQFIERFGLYTNPARTKLQTQIKEINSEIEILDLRPHIIKMRAVKQPIELETIQKAIDITSDTIKEVKKRLNKYEYEYEIEADFSSGFRKRGAMGHAFTPVIASGKNTLTIHHIRNDSSLKGVRHICFDVGAEYEHYSADLARTYFFKPPTKREAKIYNSILEIRDCAKDLLKPGVIMKEYEKQMETYVGEKLRELGLISIINKESVRKYFPHAMSHSLGLDPHDAMDYKEPLEPNMVVTIEPGIYIPEEGIGMRIEEDALVTENGIEILSKNLPLPKI